MKVLASKSERQQCVKDIVYRVNAMLAWDLMVYVKEKYKPKNERENKESVYGQSQVVVPALEISIVFGRQLLEFLKITWDRSTGKLDEFPQKNRKTYPDDILILSLYPSLTTRPLQDPTVAANEVHLIRLIKVANKAAAHLTTTSTTDDEFESMKIARQVIYQLVLKYVPDIATSDIWWTTKDDQRNAILE
ncbi:MAG TPA: hypothetical protein VEW65_03930 [Chryseolinea sp.]|nr:hypothetical protein [Chryseolinea sp.]